jgi:putative hydrolase of the HAD superfamily
LFEGAPHAIIAARAVMPFRAILFDIGDTLWHSRAAPPPEQFRRIAAERVATWLREHGYTGTEPAALARAAWDAMETAMRTARATDLVEPDYGDVARSAAREFGLDIGRDEGAGLLDAAYVSGVEGGKAPFPDALHVLAELRQRGFRLGAVTNRAFGGERFRADLRDAGLDIGWDAEAVSVEVGYLKPHPAIFKRALDELRVQPAEAVMVGNSLAEDVAGAKRLGIAAAWRRSAPDAEGVEPDFAFDELTELLQMPGLEAAP